MDHPEGVAGRSVLDFGAGSGLLSIAAMLAGADRVRAADIDAIACVAISLNAALNHVTVSSTTMDVIGGVADADPVLVGDMCYERPLAERLTVWLRRLSGQGIYVLLGGPRRK